MPKPSKKAQIAAARRVYEPAKRLYKKLGKMVLGKPKNAAIRKDYGIAKRNYKKAGRDLGRLTGVS